MTNPDTPEPTPPFKTDPIPPELLAWARQTFDEADFLAQVREIRETGGFVLDDFIAEVEARATGS